MQIPHATASLYVGDLPQSISEGNLFEVFKNAGPLASIRVCRDTITRRSLGYAYVNFLNAADAEKALDSFNGQLFNGKPCRIMWVQRDPSVRKSGVGNIFIKNLEKSITHKDLHDTFSEFGPILSCKVALNENLESKGFGFVHFERQPDADKAIAMVNGKELKGKIVFVGPFVARTSRSSTTSKDNFSNIYVKDYPTDWSEEKLKDLFSSFGELVNVSLAKTSDGKTKGFSFVNFKTHEAAVKAIEGLHGKEFESADGVKKKLYAARFQKKAERSAELRRRKDEIMQRQYEKWRGTNLYIKNIDDTIALDTINKEFSAYGSISSSTIMKDEKGFSKGFGFVCYHTPEEAERAVAEMNGKMLGAKPLYVAIAQRKDERRAQLELHHARKNTRGMAGMPPYPAPVYYPSGPMAPGFFPGPGPMGAPIGGRRGNPGAPWAGGYGMPMPPGGRPPRGDRSGGRSRAPPHAAPAPVAAAPIAAEVTPVESKLTLAQLQAFPPEAQPQILGERLYPRIASLQPERCGKITGMLLERYKADLPELLKLLESPEELIKKVSEAVTVLESHERAASEAKESDATN